MRSESKLSSGELRLISRSSLFHGFRPTLDGFDLGIFRGCSKMVLKRSLPVVYHWRLFIFAGCLSLCALNVAVGLGFRDEPSGVVDDSGGVGQPKEVKVRISDATEYKIDIGDFPMCRGVVATAILCNDTSSPLDLSFVPSCGCTKVSDTLRPIGPGESMPLSFVVSKVQSAQPLAFQLSGTDKLSGRKVSLGVTGRAVEDVSWSPQSLILRSDAVSVEEIVFTPRFEDVEVVGIDMLGFDGTVESIARHSRSYSIRLKPNGAWRDKELFLAISKKSGPNSIVCIPVVNPDKVVVSPKSIVLKQSTESVDDLVANIIVRGKEIHSFRDSIVITLHPENDAEQLISKASVVSIRTRTNDLVVVRFAVPKLNLYQVLRCRVAIAGKSEFGEWNDFALATLERE